MAISKEKAIKKLIVNTVLSQTIKKYTGYEERKTVNTRLWNYRTTEETEHIKQLKDAIIEVKHTAIEYFIIEESWSKEKTIAYIQSELETLFVIEWRDLIIYPEDLILF